jgi:type II secretion system protein I
LARGFTLIEVLVAMVILSIAFMWLLSSQGQSIEMATRSRFLTTATLLAQERISEVTSGEQTVSQGSGGGDFGEDYPGYRYEETVESTVLPGYFKYSLTVKWGSEEKPLETKFISFLTSR